MLHNITTISQKSHNESSLLDDLLYLGRQYKPQLAIKQAAHLNSDMILTLVTPMSIDFQDNRL